MIATKPLSFDFVADNSQMHLQLFIFKQALPHPHKHCERNQLMYLAVEFMIYCRKKKSRGFAAPYDCVAISHFSSSSSPEVHFPSTALIFPCGNKLEVDQHTASTDIIKFILEWLVAQEPNDALLIHCL